MDRLQAELQRLYLPRDAQAPGVRAMVLELARPPSWEVLGQAWQGVQADLELPAPAIAVSGSDGLQLWFSLAQAVPVGEASAFLEMVRSRYLAEVAPDRIRTAVQVEATPPLEVAPGQWSAFVAQDLAGLFAQEPWIDMPPSADAQADLLSRLESIRPEDWKRVVQPAPAPMASPIASVPDAPREDSPRRFLLSVMNDPSVAMPLRIEAAKALLPYVEGRSAPEAD